jgi:acetyltransferase-like isoleucine patch superfamily enzyme
MTIQQKLENFIHSHNDLCAKSVNSVHLKDIEIYSDPNNLKEIIFEKGISQNSGKQYRNSIKSFIGAYTYINYGGYIRGRVFIGRYCSIGRRVSIGADNHNANIFGMSKFLCNYNTIDNKLTIIENDVWIGDGAIILEDVRISTGAIIGANSVITKDVPAYTVVAGAPAKFIKYRFPVNLSERILKTDYFNLPREELLKLPMDNVSNFLELLENDKKFPTADYESYTLV